MSVDDALFLGLFSIVGCSCGAMLYHLTKKINDLEAVKATLQ